MTTFWSLWVAAIVLGSILGCVWLLFATRKGQRPAETEETVGHAFDGIEELDNPLPMWWFIMFMVTIAFGLIYLALYPGLGNFQGVLGWSQVRQYEQELIDADKRYFPIFQQFAQLSVEEISEDPEALKIGQRIFRNNCALCHGSAGAGAYGFPNLTDNDWLYGGTADAIKHTLVNGRRGNMPAWADTLGEEGIQNVTQYVMSLSGTATKPERVEAGEAVFKAVCVACHGADGKGNLAFGAPNLTDDIWLYGGTEQLIAHSLRVGRAGVMPAQRDLLSEDKIHILTGYVKSLSKNASP